jgi:hypothetical protein
MGRVTSMVFRTCFCKIIEEKRSQFSQSDDFKTEGCVFKKKFQIYRTLVKVWIVLEVILPNIDHQLSMPILPIFFPIQA